VTDAHEIVMKKHGWFIMSRPCFLHLIFMQTPSIASWTLRFRHCASGIASWTLCFRHHAAS